MHCLCIFGFEIRGVFSTCGHRDFSIDMSIQCELAAPMRQGRVSRDRVEPGRQTLGLAERRQFSYDLKPRLLQHVPRVLLIVHQSPDVIKNPSFPTPKEFVNRTAIARPLPTQDEERVVDRVTRRSQSLLQVLPEKQMRPADAGFTYNFISAENFSDGAA